MINLNQIINSDSAVLKTPKQSFVYACVSYLLVFPLFRILFRGKTIGIKNVPKKGSLVVVANHGSYLDPPLIGHALGRPVSFMAKAELFRIPFLSSIISACGAYPVSRGSSDREAIRVASSRLNEGWAIGVFLDGTRQKNGRVNSPRLGAALLAARTDSYLLPVAIVNSHRALQKGSGLPRLMPIRIVIGDVIPPPESRSKEDLKKTTNIIKNTINSILDKNTFA